MNQMGLKSGPLVMSGVIPTILQLNSTLERMIAQES